MNRPKYAVGRNCDAWCTRCKMDLAHTIVAMVDALPVQVKCNTCDGVHKYRAPKSAAKEAGTSARAKATTAKTSSRSATREPRVTRAERDAAETLRDIRRRWDESLGRTAAADQLPYDVRAAYTVDDVVKHPKFGLGFVVAEESFNRIKVLFQDAERVLVARHGQKPE